MILDLIVLLMIGILYLQNLDDLISMNDHLEMDTIIILLSMNGSDLGELYLKL